MVLWKFCSQCTSPRSLGTIANLTISCRTYIEFQQKHCQRRRSRRQRQTPQGPTVRVPILRTASRCRHTELQSHIATMGWVRALTFGASAGACCTGGAVSLYAQCAASPYSASVSMLLVRSCTSSGTPPGPRTAVCSDWYPDFCAQPEESWSQ